MGGWPDFMIKPLYFDSNGFMIFAGKFGMRVSVGGLSLHDMTARWGVTWGWGDRRRSIVFRSVPWERVERLEAGF